MRHPHTSHHTYRHRPQPHHNTPHISSLILLIPDAHTSSISTSITSSTSTSSISISISIHDYPEPPQSSEQNQLSFQHPISSSPTIIMAEEMECCCLLSPVVLWTVDGGHWIDLACGDVILTMRYTW